MASPYINSLTSFLQNIFQWRSSSWRAGLGVGVGAMLLAELARGWNRRLSLLINISHQLERLLFTLFPPFMLKEDDSCGINMFRWLYSSLPIRPSQKMKMEVDISIPSSEGHVIPATVYTPISQVCSEVKRPIIIHIHGGGFVIGNVPMSRPITTTLASLTGCIVVSLEYRLAPEHKCPAAHNDCLQAVQWIYKNATALGGDEEKIAVIGDSAGGNLAACVACELPEIVKLSIPVYPVISFGVYNSSKVENYNMPILPTVMMDWFTLRYFHCAEEMVNPLVCPLKRTPEELSRVQRTHVITAQFDVLRDEGVAYANALKLAGVNVTHKNYDNTVHGFFGQQSMTHGSQALWDCSEIIKGYFE